MTTDTGVTVAGTIVETIGAATTGAENIGAESKPAEKPNAIVNGSANESEPCDTVMRTMIATIVASMNSRHIANPTRSTADQGNRQENQTLVCKSSGFISYTMY